MGFNTSSKFSDLSLDQLQFEILQCDIVDWTAPSVAVQGEGEWLYAVRNEECNWNDTTNDVTVARYAKYVAYGRSYFLTVKITSPTCGINSRTVLQKRIEIRQVRELLR